MQNGVKEYELSISENDDKPAIRIYRRLRGEITERSQFPIVDYDREAAWTALRKSLRERGEDIFGIFPSKDRWTGFDQLILLTVPIEPVEKSLQDMVFGKTSDG